MFCIINDKIYGGNKGSFDPFWRFIAQNGCKLRNDSLLPFSYISAGFIERDTHISYCLLYIYIFCCNVYWGILHLKCAQSMGFNFQVIKIVNPFPAIERFQKNIINCIFWSKNGTLCYAYCACFCTLGLQCIVEIQIWNSKIDLDI